MIGRAILTQSKEEATTALTSTFVKICAESGIEAARAGIGNSGSNAVAGSSGCLDGVSTVGAERIGAGQRGIHGVAVINVIAAPVVSKLMTDQVGLARGTEPSFAKAVPNVRTADGVEVGHTNGAAIKVAPAKHLDQIALNTLLAANPMASNLIEQAASIGRVVGVTGVASDNDGRDGVRDVDFWFVVKAIHIVDVGVDFGL